MKPIIDQIYNWQGFANGVGNWESSCRLRIFQPHPEQVVVVLTDDLDSEGTSITNCVEYLLPKLAKEFNVKPEIAIWVHYQPQNSEAAREVETSQVRLSIDSGGSIRPLWSFVEKAKVESWICSSL
jgi:hypothetical protein